MRRRSEDYILIGITVSAVVLLVSAASVAGISPLQSTTESSLDSMNVTFSAEDRNQSGPVVRHQNPATIESVQPALDPIGLELARSLGIRLNVSARELREGNFTAAEAQLGSEYRSDVIQLTEIAEATENASDDEIAEAYRKAGAEQGELIQDAEEFRELYTEYQQARASDNDTRAREAARRLSEKVKDINATASELIAAYSELEQVDESQAELAQQKINQSLQQAERLAQNARSSAYTETRLVVTPVEPRGSPMSPFVLTGQLRTANGTPLANRLIELGPATHTTTVQTDQNGTFTLRHRPTVLAPGTQTVRVRYVPNETSGYLGSTASVNVSVVQLSPTIRIHSAPNTIMNGTPRRISGRVVVATDEVQDIPVAVRIGDQRIVSGRTNATGGFSFMIDPPFTIPAGPANISVVVDTSNQAVARDQRTIGVTIVEAPTTLSLSADRVGNRTMRVAGTLRRSSGQPLVAQTVTVSISNRTVGWLRTDENGRFGGNLTLVADQPGIRNQGPEITVTATFISSSTHLQAARTTDTVTLPTSAPTGLVGYRMPTRAWGLLISAVVLLCGAAILARRRLSADTSEENEEPDPEQRLKPESNPPDTEQSDSTPDNPITMLDSALRNVTEMPEYAVRLGYVAVRLKLARELGIDNHDSMTYHEFYAACQDREDDLSLELAGQFHQLTDLYEQAIYTDSPVADDQVERLLEYFATEINDSANHN